MYHPHEAVEVCRAVSVLSSDLGAIHVAGGVWLLVDVEKLILVTDRAFQYNIADQDAIPLQQAKLLVGIGTLCVAHESTCKRKQEGMCALPALPVSDGALGC